MSGAHRLSVALALGLAVSHPVAAAELWRAATEQEACHIVLINMLSGVDVRASGRQARVSSDTPGLAIEAVAGAGEVTLTIVGDGGGAPGDVELTVPPGCSASVRTGGGAVSAELAPEAFPLAVDTVTGNITVWVDPAAAVNVVLATSGEITTDYTIAIDFRYHEEPAKYGQVAIGVRTTAGANERAAAGSIEVRLTSRQGAVSVLRPTGGRSRSGS